MHVAIGKQVFADQFADKGEHDAVPLNFQQGVEQENIRVQGRVPP